MSDPNEQTRLIRRTPSEPASPGGPPSQPQHGHDPEATVYHRPYPDAVPDSDGTRIIRRGTPSPQNAPEPPPQVEDGKTVLVRPSSRSSQSAGSGPSPDEPPDGPVVGWLVIIEGPGRGRSVTLGYGMNTIGRDAANRVSLPFGDSQISRMKHATLTYDPRGRKFFLQHGESTNLTYVGETPVLSPLQLSPGDTIRLGDTTVLRFVPLCGDDFNWD